MRSKKRIEDKITDIEFKLKFQTLTDRQRGLLTGALMALLWVDKTEEVKEDLEDFVDTIMRGP